VKLEGRAKAIYEHMEKYTVTSEQLINMTDQEWWEHRLASDVEAMRINIEYSEKQKGINEKTKNNSSRLFPQ
jgi:hypothetical protein